VFVRKKKANVEFYFTDEHSSSLQETLLTCSECERNVHMQFTPIDVNDFFVVFAKKVVGDQNEPQPKMKMFK